MTIGKLCKSPVLTVSQKATIQQAATIMRIKSVGCLVCTDATEIPTGLITDRDLAIRALADDLSATLTTVESIMTKDPLLVASTQEIQDVADLMQARRVRRVLVVDPATTQLCGIVSADDLLLVISRLLDKLSDVYFLEDVMKSSSAERDYSRMA